MKAIAIKGSELVWTKHEAPTAKPSEVVVAVEATAVNRADLLQARGMYAPPAGASQILGLEMAGVVVEAGADVDDGWVGRRVAALLSGGGYAERVAVPASHLIPLPDTMPFDQAAAIPEVFYTAFLNLVMEAGLRRGESVMIHAAASGVGTAALQIARSMGCEHIIATASGGKLEGLPTLGATCCVDRNSAAFLDVVKEVTSGRGVDVILDPVAAAYLQDNVRSLATGGRLVVIGLLGGARAELDLVTLLRRRLRVIGSVLRSRSDDEKTEITKRFLKEVWPALQDGSMSPIVDRVLDVRDAGEAHDLLRNNETVGKVVLRMR